MTDRTKEFFDEIRKDVDLWNTSIVETFKAVYNKIMSLDKRGIPFIVYGYCTLIALIFEAALYAEHDFILFNYMSLEDASLMTIRNWFFLWAPLILMPIAFLCLSYFTALYAIVLRAGAIFFPKIEAKPFAPRQFKPESPPTWQERELTPIRRNLLRIAYRLSMIYFTLVGRPFQVASWLAIVSMQLIWYVTRRATLGIFGWIRSLCGQLLKMLAKCLKFMSRFFAVLSVLSPLLLAFLLADELAQEGPLSESLLHLGIHIDGEVFVDDSPPRDTTESVKSSDGKASEDTTTGKKLTFQVCTSRPPECLPVAEHIRSTRTYAFFRVGGEQGGTVVIPVGNIAYFGAVEDTRDVNPPPDPIEEVRSAVDNNTKRVVDNVKELVVAMEAVEAAMHKSGDATADHLTAVHKAVVTNTKTTERGHKAIDKAVQTGTQNVEDAVDINTAVTEERLTAVHRAVDSNTETTALGHTAIRQEVADTRTAVEAVEAAVDISTAVTEERLIAVHRAVDSNTETTALGHTAIGQEVADTRTAVEAVEAAVDISTAVTEERLTAVHRAVDSNTETTALGHTAIGQEVADTRTAVEAVEAAVDISTAVTEERLIAVHRAVDSNTETTALGHTAIGQEVADTRTAVEAVEAAVDISTAVTEERLTAVHQAVDSNTETTALGHTAIRQEVADTRTAVEAVEAAVDISTAVTEERLIAVHRAVDSNTETTALGHTAIGQEVADTRTAVEAVEAAVDISTAVTEERLTAVHQAVDSNTETTALGHTAIRQEVADTRTAVEAVETNVDKNMAATDDRLTAVREAVIAGADDTVKTLGDVNLKVADVVELVQNNNEKIVEVANFTTTINTQFPEVSVSHVNIIDNMRRGIVYLLAGFQVQGSELNSSQESWLADFYNSVTTCGNDNLPTISLTGFASSQPFETPDIGVGRELLCVGDYSGGKTIYNNCHLANQRVAAVGAYFERLRNGEERQPDDIITRMEGSCSKGGAPVPIMNGSWTIKPWCGLHDMRNRRFSNRSPGDLNQPHFLNRSVHITIEDPGGCANL